MHAERIFPALLALLGIAFIWGGRGLNFRADIAFGPGFVPLLTGGLLAVCCLIQILKLSRSVSEKEPDKEAQAPDYRSLMTALAIMVAGVASMMLGSILIPLFLMTWLLSWLVSGHNLLRAGLVSLITIAVIYTIFAIWLGLPVH